MAGAVPVEEISARRSAQVGELEWSSNPARTGTGEERLRCREGARAVAEKSHDSGSHAGPVAGVADDRDIGILVALRIELTRARTAGGGIDDSN
jgi:hypothetical protein